MYIATLIGWNLSGNDNVLEASALGALSTAFTDKNEVKSVKKLSTKILIFQLNQ